VNQLVPPNPSCQFCNKRYEMQQNNLKDISELYSDLDIVPVELFDREIRGIEELTKLGKILTGEVEE
jgi:anion-transporting  ArsA/GET3 family ATPase